MNKDQIKNYVQDMYQRSAKLQSFLTELKQDNRRFIETDRISQDTIDKQKQRRREMLNYLFTSKTDVK